MKHELQQRLQQAVYSLGWDESVTLSPTKTREHGDYSSNVALLLARSQPQSPRQLAQSLCDALPLGGGLARVDIAGPGFINFHLDNSAWHRVVQRLWHEPATQLRPPATHTKRIHLEYVSVNPTGPLHVGHGRGAVFGSVLARLLQAVGHDVWQEYYVNDAGRQMDILLVSVYLRYLDLQPFPTNGYQGDYIQAMAQTLRQQHGQALAHDPKALLALLSSDAEPELLMDRLIVAVKQMLQTQASQVRASILEQVSQNIRADLRHLGIEQHWFSEQSLVDSGAVTPAIEQLRERDVTYLGDDGNLWFRCSQYGDEKDRVLIRANGLPTYFAVDIAYHHHKMSLDFDQVWDVFGADHHGYVPRIEAALTALGHDISRYRAFLVQFATLYRGQEKLAMSTRSGRFVTLQDLYQDIGVDATRFFYVMRKVDQHMEFDVELAKRHSKDNPVYYIQYAHARINSVLKQANVPKDIDAIDLTQLDSEHETTLMRQLMRYRESLESSAQHCEPHSWCHYLRELAHAFHSYYNAEVFISQDEAKTQARLALIVAVKTALADGLMLLGIGAPERM